MRHYEQRNLTLLMSKHGVHSSTIPDAVSDLRIQARIFTQANSVYIKLKQSFSGDGQSRKFGEA